jgi:hypothetical protein
MVAIVEPDEEEKYLYAILDSADGVDLAEFALRDVKNDDGVYRLRDYQHAWFTDSSKYQIDQCGRGIGKALWVGTEILTTSGWSTMGELKPGDYVFSEAGLPVEVLEAHDVLVDRKCYEVEFSDHSTIIADEEHLWLTSDKRARRARSRRTEDELRRAESAVMLSAKGHSKAEIAGLLGYGAPCAVANAIKAVNSGRPRLRTTGEIYATLRAGKESNHSVGVAAPIRAPERDLPIDPYVLGAWLGDGNSYYAAITTMDPEILASIHESGYTTKLLPSSVRGDNKARSYMMQIPGTREQRLGETLHGRLKKIGVMKNKHIPAEYLLASERQRRALLAGVFDTDGYMRQDRRAEIALCNERLARGVFGLVASLGEAPYFSKKPAKLNGIEVGVVYTVGWSPRFNPARLTRKSRRFKDPSLGHPRTAERRIVDVRPVSSVPVRCIAVDGPSHLYLAGRTLIPTHNTESAKLRCLAFPFYHSGRTTLITAPEDNHMRLLCDEVEQFLLSTRISREMLPKNAAHGIARQPHWQVRFRNGTMIVSRLPNKDGRGVKGVHCTTIEHDEGQNYPPAGWLELPDTLNAGEEGAMWRVHGVSRGIHDEFWRKTQPGSGWTVHRWMAMHRPDWTDEERQAKIHALGGSRQSVDYGRNIYGEHGNASNVVFILANLMDCVDLDKGGVYNTDVYTCIRVKNERFPKEAEDEERAALIEAWIDVPETHLVGYSQKVRGREVGSPKGYSAYWAGMDVGMVSDPSEILVFGQRYGEDLLELLLRIQMLQVNATDQKVAVAHVFSIYGDKLRAFGIDITGQGRPIGDELTRAPFGARVHGYNFSKKYIVGFEGRDLKEGETKADLAQMRGMLEAATDWLRNDYVDPKRMRLPNDSDVIGEWQGQTYMHVKDAKDPYTAKRVFSGGSLHTLDSAKTMVAAKHIPPLEALLVETKPPEPVLDIFMGAW